MNREEAALDQAVWKTIGFLQGLADGLEPIAPDKATRCLQHAIALGEAHNAVTRKEAK